MYRAFYATNHQAKKWGRTLTKRATISREDAIKLRDYYKFIEGVTNADIGVLLTVLGVSFNSVISMVLGITTTISSVPLSDYLQDLDNKFDMLATSRDNISFVEYTFQYREHGSGGGAYFLKDVRLV